MKTRVWTAEMVAHAQQLVGKGMTYADVDRRLNLRRGATAAKLSVYSWSEEKRSARRDQINEWRRGKPRQATANFVASVQSIPAEVIADRDRRMALERSTVTATCCGDPLPGYSALDQRTSPL